MGASSVTTGIFSRADYRRWEWWKIPVALRTYVAGVVLTAIGLICYAATQTHWSASDLLKYLLLLACALGSVAATPRSSYVQGRMTRDFITVWVLPVAILLPPVYALIMPAPLYVLTQFRVHRGVIYR